MRIPNLNVSQSITQQIRDLDLQRLQLNDQISTGQKITHPEDDGLKMARVIQLDSQKGKLAQYQRNASYATEFLSAGQMNLEKLREINQRAQEIARLAGSNLYGPAVQSYAYEIDELIEEALNRLNAKQRGRALFGGKELKPDFSVSEIIAGQKEKKILDLENSGVGVEAVGGSKYLKQGDEVTFRMNGREYVVQAKVSDVSSEQFFEGVGQWNELVEVGSASRSIPKIASGQYVLDTGVEDETELYLVKDLSGIPDLPPSAENAGVIHYDEGFKINYESDAESKLVSRPATSLDLFASGFSSQQIFSLDGSIENARKANWDGFVELPSTAVSLGVLYFNNGFKILTENEDGSISESVPSFDRISQEVPVDEFFSVDGLLYLHAMQTLPSDASSSGTLFYDGGFKVKEPSIDGTGNEVIGEDGNPVLVAREATEEEVSEKFSGGDVFYNNGSYYRISDVPDADLLDDPPAEQIAKLSLQSFPSFNELPEEPNEPEKIFYQQGKFMVQEQSLDASGDPIVVTREATLEEIGKEYSPGDFFYLASRLAYLKSDGRSVGLFAEIPDEKATWDDIKNDYATVVTQEYSKGDVVKVTRYLDDSILVDPKEFDSVSEVLERLGRRDWSASPFGSVVDGGEVYLIDADQISEIAAPLGQQPNLSITPEESGFFALVERDGSIFLEPVHNEVDLWKSGSPYEANELVFWKGKYYSSNESQAGSDFFDEQNWTIAEDQQLRSAFRPTAGENVTYWEAASDEVYHSPGLFSSQWVEVNPFSRTSNLSNLEAARLMEQLINGDAEFIEDSLKLDTSDYSAFVRASSDPSNSRDLGLKLSAKLTTSGVLEVSGNVGKSFSAEAEYLSMYDSRNYYPEQFEKILQRKASSLYPGREYAELSNGEKEIVWGAIRDTKLSWDLSVIETSAESDSKLEVSLPKPWKRLHAYQEGEVVEHEGKLWESLRPENFNHLPTKTGSEFWKELGGDYDVDREDWKIIASGVQTRTFFSGPDGRLFDSRSDAENHTVDLLVNSTRSYPNAETLWSDVDKLVKEIDYPVTRFDAQASDSSGFVYFDPESQSYRLSTMNEGQAPVEGTFVKGSVKTVTDPEVAAGDVVKYGNSYFLTLNAFTEEESERPENLEIIADADASGNLNGSLIRGETIYQESTRRLYLALGEDLPIEGMERTLSAHRDQSLRKGAYVYDRATSGFYVATKDVADASAVDFSAPNSSFASVGTFAAMQGSQWSSDQRYLKGQIVLHDGVYYECQTNGKLGPQGEVLGFDNKDDEETLGSDGDYHFPSVSPSDSFFVDLADARSRESMDLLKARGEPVQNNAWLPLSKPLNHVFTFTVENQDAATIRMQPAGPSGVDAAAKLMTDANGVVTGLRVENPGRYFFPSTSGDPLSSTIPETYRTAEVILANGDSLLANVIWGQNPNDPGPYVVTGFELPSETLVTDPIGPQTGDDFSFATGRKTFLDHRDADGNIIGVTYTGSDENAEFFVGKDSKVSSFLSAGNEGTSKLADSISSLIDLRDGLTMEDLPQMSQRVQLAERQLIEEEELVVDKMGEISSVLVRIDTVRAHDEQYHLELDRRLSQELDLDLSEAIMRLTQVSTAYQAAMQIGAQLLNTSLLNYL